MSPKGPERTCIGCRATDRPDDMVRLVASPDDVLVVDLRGRLPGRGAWVHPRRECLERAVRSVPKALTGRGRPRPIDASDLPERVRGAVVHALGDALSMAAAGGGLARGRSAVAQSVQDGRAVAVLLACDAAERTARQVQAWLDVFDEDEVAPELHTLPFDSEDVGQRVGRGTLAVVGVLDTSATRHLRRQLRRFRSLG